MTEQEYAAFVIEQRGLARDHLDRLLLAQRRSYWPHGDDPIDREDRARRDRFAILARSLPVLNLPHAAVMVSL